MWSLNSCELDLIIILTRIGVPMADQMLFPKTNIEGKQFNAISHGVDKNWSATLRDSNK